MVLLVRAWDWQPNTDIQIIQFRNNAFIGKKLQSHIYLRKNLSG